ncbi:hypothetical protein OIE69_03215 [Actinacidiphila glaucinigra]|uniref:hypothetical protein n=1 Tax=Actinacidiphila glaucinigra TaxID=235986 RepID=UPI002DDB810E|nr:hypothetical protein [Actinacidiphila glaucinigra]WSD57978.1 hypothetical protein OIE69_03215 [Actinacidiphila glaucinigra]
MIKQPVRRLPGAPLLAVPLAALLLSCAAPSDDGSDRTAASTRTPVSASASASASASTPADSAPPADGQPEVTAEKVRDAFATLQATYHSGCTPSTSAGECEYFLTRVRDELAQLDEAMKADPQGPGHFREPLAWTAELHDTLGTDTSFENLKKHQDQIVATRDRINRWMQGHPEDYR